MWSDRTDPVKLDDTVRALHAILRAPAPGAASTSLTLDSPASPEQVAALFREERGFVWLDGSLGRHLLFHDPLAVISCSRNKARGQGPHGELQLSLKPMELLEAAVTAWSGPSGAMLAGYIGYDIAADLEQIRLSDSSEFDLPDLYFGLFDSVLMRDAEKQWTWSGTNAWRSRNRPPALPAKSTGLALDDLHGSLSPGPLESKPDSAVFVSAVDRLVERIHGGDFFQTNLCRQIAAPLDSHLVWPLYQRLRYISPAEFGAFIHIGAGRALLSVSPELFLKVSAGGLVETRPIKGTRGRGATTEEDQELRSQLLESDKDRAELAMIVDVSRNDLGRVCRTGSVKVREHARLMTLPTLHHTVSQIEGTLRPDSSVIDLLRAAFPPASVTGAPKIEAMRAATQEEGTRRGPAMGTIGWISLDGQLELSVAIRTAFTDAGRVFYSAGCGITAESESLAELQESRTKASAFLRALGLADV